MTAYSISRVFRGGVFVRQPLQPRVTECYFHDRRLSSLFYKLPKNTQTRIINQGVGVEIEVENAVNREIDGWVRVTDNSLRDNGMEYKTRFGQRIGQVNDGLKRLELDWNQWKVDNRRPHHFNFSERTSVHVHLDARNMSTDEIISLVQVYTIFEDALFEYAGTSRKDNVFCIPLRYSAMDYRDYTFLDLHAAWAKYLAINICPLSEFGTVEFRHMAGTSDYSKIMTWIILLALMVDYVKARSRTEVDETILKMKLESNYFKLIEEIFGPFGGYLQTLPVRLDQAVSDAKLLFGVGRDIAVLPPAPVLFNPADFNPAPRRNARRPARVVVEPAQPAEPVGLDPLRADFWQDNPFNVVEENL
jgi:hypothetical protein